MSKNTAVFGIYPSLTSVEIAVDELKASGFRSANISVLFPESAGTRDFAHEKSTKAPEGATAGASSGAILGGALGWLIGIGALAVPGVGPFIAAGPIMAALAGVGLGGTVGGIAGRSLVWAYPSTRRNVMRARYRAGEFYCQFTRKHQSGPHVRKKP